MSRARDRADGDYKTDSSVIDFGADGDVTLTHDPDDGLILKSKATADDNPVLLTLQTGETDLAANDVIGKIAFQAPDEGTGTDAILVSAAIQAVAEGDHSSSSNATSLQLMTGASEAAAEKVRIDSAGNVGILNTSPSSYGNATELVVGSHSIDDAGITIATTTGSSARFQFSDNTGSPFVGCIEYAHSSDRMMFYTNASKKMELYSGGRLDLVCDQSGDYAFVLIHDGNNSDRYGLLIRAGADDASGTNYAIGIHDGDNTAQGYVTFSGGTVTYGAFTAHHEISLPDADKSSGYDYGTLVEIDKIYYTQKNDSDTERGIRYLVKKSQSAYSRKVLGAYCGDMLAVADKDILYTEEDTIPDGKKVGDVKTDGGTYKNNLHQAAVLGDGHIICNGEKGNISIGDGICTSSTEGVGMKADKMAMIIGIAQEDVTFSSASETKLVPVQYGVRQFTPWTD
mgnify:CR=1 FL=1